VTRPDEQTLAIAVATAIRSGDLEGLQQLLRDEPTVATGRFNGRTALHVVTDWPGYFPHGPAIVRLLVAAGADPNASTGGGAPETPLHWAASSDDVEVAEALVDAGADLETPGGSIGTPLDNAVGYGCWHVARLLVARGARVERLWHAAALGDLNRLDELLTAGAEPGQINEAFWHACRAGQRRTAEHLLLHHSADLNTTVDYAHGTALDVATGLDTRRDQLATWLREQGAQTSNQPG
jgi:ankyrin repeat protein